MREPSGCTVLTTIIFCKNKRISIKKIFNCILLQWRFDASCIIFKEEVKGTSPKQQENVVCLILPFKDKKSANIVRKQLAGLGSLIGKAIRPVFTSRKVHDDVKIQELKPPLVNHQCVVYKFKCDLCDADYVGYTCRHAPTSTHWWTQGISGRNPYTWSSWREHIKDWKLDSAQVSREVWVPSVLYEMLY
jgi:hypothetical protein